jgi:hypothetical protein
MQKRKSSKNKGKAERVPPRIAQARVRRPKKPSANLQYLVKVRKISKKIFPSSYLHRGVLDLLGHALYKSPKDKISQWGIILYQKYRILHRI